MTKPQQSTDKNASQSPHGISISLAPFKFEEPRHWFTQLVFFFLQNIDTPLAKYYTAISQLPREQTREIQDLVQAALDSEPHEKLRFKA